MRPRALWSWAPSEEDESCLRAVSDENEQAETWGWGKKGNWESVNGEDPGEQLWWLWVGSHGDPTGRETPDGEGDSGNGEGVGGFREDRGIPGQTAAHFRAGF